MQLQDVLSVLRRVAPESLAESWDKVGVHISAASSRQDIRRAMLCIDLVPAVMKEAIRERVQMIVAYHPPIFDPLTGLNQHDWKQGMLMEAVRRGIMVYSPHTALDAAAGGINDWLCDGLGDGTVQAIKQAQDCCGHEHHCGCCDTDCCAQPLQQGQYKVVTFVPVEKADVLRQALSKAGAGVIGAYRDCSFMLKGEGTFCGDESTNPAVGKKGRLEKIAEIRLEMVCPLNQLKQVIAKLRATHPYEEPAIDVYPLVKLEGLLKEHEHVEADVAEQEHEYSSCQVVGAGRILMLDKPVSLTELVTSVKRRLKVKQVEVAMANSASGKKTDKRVQNIGVCVGSGGSLLAQAGDIDVFLTGEMRHHDVLAAVQKGVSVILAGHTQTERPYLAEYRRRLQAEGGKPVKWLISRKDQPASVCM